MLKQQIIDAMAAGRKCYWRNTGYRVVVKNGDLYTLCVNGSMQFLDDPYLADVYESKE